MQGEALRDLNLAAHQVDSGDHFGDGVLHLDARVDFDEEPLAGAGIDQEFRGVHGVCGMLHDAEKTVGTRRGRLRLGWEKVKT